MAAAGITRVFPDLTDDLLLNLFHKGAKAQWTSRDLDWSAPPLLTERQKVAMARLLTPVYFGEQTAMAGAGSILARVMAAGETTAQVYLGLCRDTMLLANSGQVARALADSERLGEIQRARTSGQVRAEVA